jgi:hypothetical protein
MGVGAKAKATVRLLGEPGSTEVSPHIWRFPVEATKPENAIMTAVDDLGNAMMRFRRAPPLRQGIFGNRVGYSGTQIVLSPGVEVRPELFLIAAVTSPFLIKYFPTGGFF